MKLLTQVYELEGLLLVIDKHGADTPALVYDRVKETGTKLAEMTQLMAPRRQEPQPIVPDLDEEPEQVPVIEQLSPSEQPPVEEQLPTEDSLPVEEHLPAQDYDAEDTWQHDNGEEPLRNYEFTYQEPSHVTSQAGAAPTPSAIADGIRVDEKLQRTISKDFRHAFSINDRFRFRRELFSNSDAEMNDALDMVESMHSLEEAEDYFYGDLGWDKEVEEVADFMEIVRRHFL